MLLSFQEIIDIAIMTAAVGYIFMGIWRQFKPFNGVYSVGFDWRAFKLACLVTAPALILHELFHKFVAIAFGLFAIFHASYFWLLFGLVLKTLNSPVLFFVPAYVSIACPVADCVVSPSTSALTAFAGPFANLLLFGVCWFWLKKKRLPLRTKIVFYVSKQINFFLFVLNMLPFPLFDGWKVYEGLFYLIKSVF